MRGAAGGTQPARLDDLPADGKAAILAEPAQALDDRIVLKLLGRTAIVANHELALVRMLDIVAGDKRADALDLVDELVRHQKIEGAIDGRRTDLAAFAVQCREQRISADRLASGKDQLEHPSAHRGQPGTAGCADLLCALQRALDVPRSHASTLQCRTGGKQQTPVVDIFGGTP